MLESRVCDFRGTRCKVLAEGKVASYGEVLGAYVTFEYRDAHYTKYDVRGHGVTAIGSYYDCKLDRVAKVVFVSMGFNDHMGVIALDISGDGRNREFVNTYNSLYVASILEDLPVSVEISNSMIIAWSGEKQALINRIVETPEEFTILGYKDEVLHIPRKAKTWNVPAVSQEYREVASRDAEAAELAMAEELAAASATHRFEDLEG